MKPRPGSRTAYKGIGATLFIVGCALEFALRLIPDEAIGTPVVVLGFLPLALTIGGAFLFWRGRQYSAKMEAERILASSGPTVLYLRTFKSDPSTAGHVLGALVIPRLISGMATDEEQLADAVRPLGQLIAIGRPGEGLPKPGAARIYSSDGDWKAVVQGRMREARLVIIRAGEGEGLLWELKEAIAVLDPRRLLILVLDMKLENYESFRLAARSVIHGLLPEGSQARRFRRISGFIVFDANWTSTLLPLHAPYFRRSGFKPYRRLFKHTLRPVFERFGLEWQPPPISILNVVLTIILALFGLLLVYIIVTSI
jgi:hypothetical protein